MSALFTVLRVLGAYVGLLAGGMSLIAIGAGTYEYFDGRHNLPAADMSIEHSGEVGVNWIDASHVAADVPVRVRVVPEADPSDLSDYDGLEITWVLMRDSTVIKRASGGTEFSFSARELIEPAGHPAGVGGRYSISFSASDMKRRIVRKKKTLVKSLYGTLRITGGLSMDPTTGELTVAPAVVATPSFHPEPPVSVAPGSSAPASPAATVGSGSTPAPASAPTGAASAGLVGSVGQ